MRLKLSGVINAVTKFGRNLLNFARTRRFQRQTPMSKTRPQATAPDGPMANRRVSVDLNPLEVPLVQPQSPQSPPRINRICPSNPDYHPDGFLHEDIRPNNFDLILQSDEPIPQVMEKHAWNPDDRSLNIYVKDDDPLTLHRLPVSQSTDCIRGRVGYSIGFHVWEIIWPIRQRGTHAVIGVSTKEAELHNVGYSSLVGSSTESYGWDLIRNQCLHDSKNTSSWVYPSPEYVRGRFTAPERFYCILDMDNGYMAFATDDCYLGVAFRGIRGKVVYPIVSAVWGHCEVTMRYLGSLNPQPRRLTDICRRTIRLQMGPKRINQVDSLHLPASLKDYVLFRQRY
ncbi:SPRY domain-containing SOCS box protein 4 [Aphelenchoides besseyi]|nr:SPRY domain-containing SOCS box protein 4 [Aphelenchoides besseyi]KAI6228396.1 SPRY domain-containing SOCS box protein 4 [Aphelenchoides besseyi]